MATEEEVQNKQLRLESSLSESGAILLNRHIPSGYVGVNESLHMISSNNKRIDGKCKHLEIPHQKELTGRVISSCNGLLCLACSMGSSYAIYNPITKEKMVLPELELHPQCNKTIVMSSGFGYDLINNKYKVVVAYDYRSYNDDGRLLLKATGDIITLGESSWTRLQFPEGRFDMYQPAVFINGSFHWVNGWQKHWGYNDNVTYQFNGILTLDISTEKFNLIKYSSFIDLQVSSRLHVVNSGKSLVLAGDNLYPVQFQFQVWKLLGTKPDGSCLYQYMALDVREKIKQLLFNSLNLKLVGALDNGNFLFKASKHGLMDGSLHHLVLYDTEKNDCSILEVSAEVPKVWDATIFQPSLVSPPSVRNRSH